MTNVYISEIVQAMHRGRIGSWNEIASNVGMLLGDSSGLAFLGMSDVATWRGIFAIGIILPVIMICLAICVLPESPRYLAMKGRDEEAIIVLQKMYPDKYDVKIIVNEIKKGIENETSVKNGAVW